MLALDGPTGGPLSTGASLLFCARCESAGSCLNLPALGAKHKRYEAKSVFQDGRPTRPVRLRARRVRGRGGPQGLRRAAEAPGPTAAQAFLPMRLGAAPGSTGATARELLPRRTAGPAAAGHAGAASQLNRFSVKQSMPPPAALLLAPHPPAALIRRRGRTPSMCRRRLPRASLLRLAFAAKPAALYLCRRPPTRMRSSRRSTQSKRVKGEGKARRGPTLFCFGPVPLRTFAPFSSRSAPAHQAARSSRRQTRPPRPR